MKNKIRKCGYARVSSQAEEQEHSLVFQTYYYKSYIESDTKAEFVGIYADMKSGENTRRRPQFKQMIQACKRGEIDYIITKSISRFARSLVETLQIVRELREIGVGIYFEKEQIDTLKSTSDFMLSIYSTVAEGELTSMSEQVKWAARRRFADGSVESNSNIYGFTLVNKILTPVPHEAIIVKEMFERYASGEGAEKIAKNLNARGVKTKIGAAFWQGKDIVRVISNEKHCGCALLQKTYHEGFKSKKNNGELPQYFVENNHEAIVSRELFDRVQARIEDRKRKVKQVPVKRSPFSGKIRCTKCGKGYLHRKNNRNTPYEKWIWSCQTYIHRGREFCGGHNIREKDFLRLFLSAYNEAANFKPHDVKNLDEAIKDLLAQERELIALKARGYMPQEDYEQQHAELLQQIRETEEEFAKQSQRQAILEQSDEYSDRMAAALDTADIYGYMILFKFKNGAEVSRIFSNDVDRKETWNKKFGRVK